MQEEGRCLLVFTKNPILGSAKTRIGKVKGDDVALAVYKRLLRYTCDIASEASAKKVVYFNKFIEEEGIWDDGFSKRMQEEGDLGVKMAAAFNSEFSESTKVILIGSDCAEISSSDIEDAFEKLEKRDLVLGPAEDGGYYLIGMNAYYDSLFQDMPWSQENLLEKTLERASEEGLDFYMLPIKSDIDFWEDWERTGWQLDT